MYKYACFAEALKNCGIEFRRDVSAKTLTTFKTGGTVGYCLYPTDGDKLSCAVKLCREYDIRHFVLGRGSNSVVSDLGFDGAAILTSKICNVRGEISDDKTLYVFAGCGISLTGLSNAVANAGFSGLEFACGIPGSVGGAVFMNAGAYGSQMSDITVSSDYYDTENDKFGSLSGAEQNFGYRHSAYSEHDGKIIVLSATLRLAKAPDKNKVLETCRKNMSERRQKQPLEYPNAGSVFKRHDDLPMGKVIEDCGLKGYTVGGAQVSDKHAGFIVNRNNASTSDIMKLIDLISERVYKEYGFLPEREIRFIE